MIRRRLPPGNCPSGEVSGLRKHLTLRDFTARPRVPMPTRTDAPPALQFSGYQKIVIAMLAFLQFAVIIDFMLMAPLGALIMPALGATPAQFGTVVSAYAFAAGVSGFLTAGFADRFDRKKLLLFFYTGFIGGSAWCGLATSFESLLLARIVTGLFGGVIGSIVLAIATDLFDFQMRGRVMGYIQTAFSASQVLGLPAGLLIAFGMKPVNAHLALKQERSPFMHLAHTVSDRRYWLAFLLTMLLP